MIKPALSGVLVALVGVLLFSFVAIGIKDKVFSGKVPKCKASDLKVGMLQSDVVKLCGEPYLVNSTIAVFKNGDKIDTSWSYSKNMTTYMFLSFDETGKLYYIKSTEFRP